MIIALRRFSPLRGNLRLSKLLAQFVEPLIGSNPGDCAGVVWEIGVVLFTGIWRARKDR